MEEGMRKTRKELHQEVVTLRQRLNELQGATYVVTREGDSTHEHKFDEWELKPGDNIPALMGKGTVNGKSRYWVRFHFATAAAVD